MALFKSFNLKEVIVSNTFGHRTSFQPGEERDIPEVLVKSALEAGLVPVANIEQLEAVNEKVKAEKEAEAAEKAEADSLKAAEDQANALAEASEKSAARSAAAKKAAATRKAKAAAEAQSAVDAAQE